MAWVRKSCLQAIANAVNAIDDIGIQVQDQPRVQHYIVKRLRDHNFLVEAIAPQIAHRARLISTASSAHASTMMEQAKQSAKSIPQYILLTFVRAWCNAWCTAKRMGQTGPCPFCGLDNGSDICHFAVCSSLHRAGRLAVPQLMACRWPDESGMNAFLGIGEGQAATNTLIVIHDLVHTAMLDAKHGHSLGGTGTTRVFRSRIRQVVRRAPYMRLLYS